MKIDYFLSQVISKNFFPKSVIVNANNDYNYEEMLSMFFNAIVDIKKVNNAEDIKQQFLNNNFHDLIKIDAGNKITATKSDLSEMLEKINLTPIDQFGVKFLIIYDVENLDLKSINALLKIIEEPYDDMYVILFCKNYDKIMQTIKSRCLYLNFQQSNNNNKNEFIFEKNIQNIGNNFLNLIESDQIYVSNVYDEFKELNTYQIEKLIDYLIYQTLKKEYSANYEFKWTLKLAEIKQDLIFNFSKKLIYLTIIAYYKQYKNEK